MKVNKYDHESFIYQPIDIDKGLEGIFKGAIHDIYPCEDGNICITLEIYCHDIKYYKDYITYPIFKEKCGFLYRLIENSGILEADETLIWRHLIGCELWISLKATNNGEEVADILSQYCQQDDEIHVNEEGKFIFH